MKETQFIRQNQEKWAAYEEMLRHKQRNPERLNELFIQITDDLSYARTFYPNRSVRMYLNGLAQRIFHNVYRGKRIPSGMLLRFWTHEVPRLYREERRALWLAFGVFVLSFSIGVVSSIIDPDFARTILGDAYVDMTEANIEKGDPMAVYKEHDPLGMSVGIALNNLFVALRTAVFGVLASIGTLFILMYNGIMVGAFQYFFVEKGVSWESFLTIWIHGTLEIGAIVLAGASGLVMGRGLLFPGSYTRMQAFQISMRRGLKMFIALIPIFILAAFFEGFLTRFTDTPAPVRALFILISFVFLVGYFVWLPWYKDRRGAFPVGADDLELPPDRRDGFRFSEIKGPGEVFSDAFSLLRRHGQRLWVLIGVSALATGLAGVWLTPPDGQPPFVFHSFYLGALHGARDFFGFREHHFLLGVQTAITLALALLSFSAIRAQLPEDEKEKYEGWAPLLSGGWLALPIPALFFLVQIQYNVLGWLLAIAVAPVLGLWCVVLFFERSNPFTAVGRTLHIARWWDLLTLGFLLVNFLLLLMLFLDTGVWRVIQQFFSWMIPTDGRILAAYSLFTTTFAAAFILYFIFVLLFLSAAFLYFSLREVADARHLQRGIPTVGVQRQIRGLARE